MEASFETVLTPEQKLAQEHDVIQTRIDNERYLREHPEVKEILNYFMKQVLLHKPENLRDFAAGLFSDISLSKKIALDKRQ